MHIFVIDIFKFIRCCNLIYQYKDLFLSWFVSMELKIFFSIVCSILDELYCYVEEVRLKELSYMTCCSTVRNLSFVLLWRLLSFKAIRYDN